MKLKIEGRTEEEADYLPSPSQVLGHERGNTINFVYYATEDHSPDEMWSRGGEVTEAWDSYKKALDTGDFESAELFRTDLEDLAAEAPKYPSSLIHDAMDVFDPVEAYAETLRSGSGDRYTDLWHGDSELEVSIPLSNESVELDYILSPFTEDENIDIHGSLEGRVRGDESLRLLPETQVKNWYDHGQNGVENPKMDVWIDETDEDRLITVQDNGPGIDPDRSDEIYKIGVGDNTGIGLGVGRLLSRIAGGDTTYIGTEETGMAQVIRLPKRENM